MTRQWFITHRTTYRFTRPVEYSIHQAHLLPLADDLQAPLTWRVDAEPATSRRVDVDGNGNRCEVFTTNRVHDHFTLSASGAVSVTTPPPVADVLRGADEAAWLARTDVLVEIAPYRQPTALTAMSPAIAAWIDPLRDTRVLGIWPAAIELADLVRSRLFYGPGYTHSSTTAAEVFALGRGVCQDYAHLYLAAARALQIPARYVSGYVQTGGDIVADGATHAWIEVYVPGYGWAGLDPTAGLPVVDRHVRLAVGRDYLDVAPVKGFRRGGGHGALVVDVTVRELAPAAEAAAAMVPQ